MTRAFNIRQYYIVVFVYSLALSYDQKTEDIKMLHFEKNNNFFNRKSSTDQGTNQRRAKRHVVDVKRLARIISLWWQIVCCFSAVFCRYKIFYATWKRNILRTREDFFCTNHW